MTNFIKDDNQNSKVVAIIPTFNEAKRIGNVLKVVTRSPVINEIIVVDDGSRDETESVVKKFPNVKYLKNTDNIGKGGSMDRAVKATDAEIIFFCDADLHNLSEEIIEGIIRPVLSGETSMFIGLRSNFMQKSVRLFALNSGERALKREVWETLPKRFKYKYRVEAGLNWHVKHNFGGFKYKTFNYSQPVKESKYGFWEGMVLRWGMNFDVLQVYCENLFKKVLKTLKNIMPRSN
ncbi:MAG: glycosyltransferase family 2 protein [Candidatus Spechtbacterales bacterium]